MLKFKVCKYIWVIGVPRSGTSFLTDYLGQYANYCFNEPWDRYPLETPQYWSFPRARTIVFKYCANWRSAKILARRFKRSYFIHLIRRPADVIESMVYPKRDSVPYRDLFTSKIPIERFEMAVIKWKEFYEGSTAVCQKHRGIEVVYERLPQELDRLRDFINLPLRQEDLIFHCKNKESSLEQFWNLPEFSTFNNLRRKIEQELY